MAELKELDKNYLLDLKQKLRAEKKDIIERLDYFVGVKFDIFHSSRITASHSSI